MHVLGTALWWRCCYGQGSAVLPKAIQSRSLAGAWA
jgi:hypothetical protein